MHGGRGSITFLSSTKAASERERRALSEPAKLARSILETPWSTVSALELAAERDKLAKVIRRIKEFKPKAFLGVWDTWDLCMKGVR